MKHQNGIVLFTTILMLAMITVLILSLMQAVFLYAKASNHLAHRHEIFYQLESAAHQLSALNLLSSDDACMLKGEAPDKIVNLLKFHKGCQINMNHHVFEYLIDDLGVFPCLQIDSNHHLDSSHHYLLTVAIHQLPQLEWIQLRIAKRIAPLPCDEETRLIHEGILSWAHQVQS